MDNALLLTIQEITLQAYEFKIYNTLQDEYGKGRDEIFGIFQDWAKEFEDTHKAFDWGIDGEYYDEIDLFLEAKKHELEDKL